MKYYSLGDADPYNTLRLTAYMENEHGLHIWSWSYKLNQAQWFRVETFLEHTRDGGGIVFEFNSLDLLIDFMLENGYEKQARNLVREVV